MIKKILIAIAVVILILGAVVAMQPSAYLVSRTTSIAAPLPDAYGMINDFHNWDKWSPWGKLDPDMKTTYDGRSSGPGAIYAWTGNDKVGEGKMTILDGRPGELIRMKLEFIKPFPSTAITEFAFSGAAGATTVTWSMTGENNFLEKGMCLFMGGIDKMIGPDLEKGLAQLKTTVESAAGK